LQTILIKIHDAKMFAVAAILPLKIVRGISRAFEIDLAKNVATIFTFDGALARSEEALLMFTTEYSHCYISLGG